MGIKTINVETTEISKVLSRPLNGSDFSIVDYLVDTTMINKTVAFKNQYHSAFTLEVNLEVDIEKVVQNKISGYDINIFNAMTGQYLYHRGDDPIPETVHFMDDFPNIMDHGEKDFNAFIKQIKTAKDLLIAEQLDDSAVMGNVTVNNFTNTSFVNLQSDSNFAQKARSLLLNETDAGTESALAMPAFKLASEAIGPGSAATSGNQNDGDITYPVPMGEKFSLMNYRKKWIEDQKTSSPHAYKAEQTIVSPPKPGTSTVLGKYIKISNPYFASTRRFEIPASFVNPHPESLEIIISPRFTEDVMEATKEGESILKTHETFVDVEFRNSVKSLFSPEIPPQIKIYQSSPGKVSLAIDKGDPCTAKVNVHKRYYDSNDGKIKNYGPPHQVNFSPLEPQHKMIENQTCLNIGPYIPQFVVATTPSGGPQLSSFLWGRNFEHNDYIGNYNQDTVTVNAFNKPGGIQVVVTTAPTGDLHRVYLYKENMILPTDNQNRVTQLSVIHPTGGDETSFLDVDVAPGRSYRYFTVAEVKHPDSPVYEKYESSNDEIIERRASSKNRLYNVTITELDGGGKLRINVAKKQSDFNLLISAISSSEFSSSFKDDITDGKYNLLDLVTFQVERINKVTGHREFIEQIEANQEFVDTRPRDPLTTYTYVFKMALTSPRTLKLFQPDKFQDATDEELQYLEQNIIEMTGANPAHPGAPAELSFYTTGLELTHTHYPAFPSTTMELTGGPSELMTSSGTGYALSWSIDGDASYLIDRFIVCVEYQGLETTLHNQLCIEGWTGNYLYVDPVYYNEIGKKTYFLRAVFNDLSLSERSNVVEVIKLADCATEVLASSAITSATETSDSKALGDLTTMTF